MTAVIEQRAIRLCLGSGENDERPCDQFRRLTGSDLTRSYYQAYAARITSSSATATEADSAAARAGIDAFKQALAGENDIEVRTGECTRRGRPVRCADRGPDRIDLS
jgi:hypothetical protein